ncbi:MAG: hypothetical protein IJZ34_11015 [Lachnospiraceae bacterium]|nr:hypothetical protein [Lachnospiraceae bacterium]
MYESTHAFGELIQQDSRTFQAFITLGENFITDGIKSIKFSGGSNSEDDFSIGSAVSQYVEISIENTGVQFEGKEFYLQIGMLVNNIPEYVPMGYFTAEKPAADEELIIFTARDRMAKMDKVCSLNLPDNTDTIEVLQTIGTLRGVPIITTDLTAIPMKNPKGYTYRQVLSLIAQMHGGFAICNRLGQIEIRTYADSEYTVGPGRYWGSFTHNDFPFVVERFICTTGETDESGNVISISAGDGARGFSFSNEFMTQSILDEVWEKLKNFTYMPGTVRFLGDPRIDSWDILTIIDREGNEYRVPAMKLNHEYDGGFTTTIEAVGKSEEEQEEDFKGPLSQQIEQMAVELVLANKAIVNKLDAEFAAITYATIANLDAVNANVENLNADYAAFKEAHILELDAAVADIDILNADMANLKTFLAGNGAAGDFQVIHLTTENAVLDSALVRVAVMESVSVNDLLAGTISTDRFRIASDDGEISIEGATQQWRDENGVIRMQAGRDANGDFTFALFDATGEGILIDHTGVQEGAIADGVIVNSMVSDAANIDASKLDIASLFREMNGSSEILYASRIYLDTEGQTLIQAYSQMISDILSTESRVTNIESGIDGVRINISDLQTDLSELTDNTLLYNVKYQDNGDGTITLTAQVFKDGKNVAESYPESWFTWRKRTEDEEIYLGYGYSITVNTDDYEFGGVCVGRFTTYEIGYLTTRSGRRLKTRSGKYITVWRESA